MKLTIELSPAQVRVFDTARQGTGATLDQAVIAFACCGLSNFGAWHGEAPHEITNIFLGQCFQYAVNREAPDASGLFSEQEMLAAYGRKTFEPETPVKKGEVKK